MAPKVLETVDIPVNAAAVSDGDDDISLIHSVNKGSTKPDAISVEDYRRRSLRRRRAAMEDFFQNPYFDYDDDGRILYSFPRTRRRRFFKGECSNSNSVSSTDLITPLTFMCGICTDEKPTDENFRVSGCKHSYCNECMRKYVASKLQENIISVKCPDPGCKGFLEPRHCRSILPKQVFHRWGDALCEGMILASEKFNCPFKDCSALLVDDTRGKKEVICESECPDCNRLFCGQCKVPWHAGLTCAKFQKLNKDERSNEDIMLRNLAKGNKWKRCPKCKFFVEKISGCESIICRCGQSLNYNRSYKFHRF